MASSILNINANLIFERFYYGAPYDYVKSTFHRARTACGIPESNAYLAYDHNAPDIPDENAARLDFVLRLLNGLVPPYGACIRISSTEVSRQLVDIFTQAMKQYEDPLPRSPPQTYYSDSD